MSKPLKYAFIRFAKNSSANSAEELRKAFIAVFPQNEFANRHLAGGGFSYSAPLLQFKELEGAILAAGYGEAAKFLEENAALIGGRIGEAELETGKSAIEFTETAAHYSFLTPWVALNQQNSEEYRRANLLYRAEILNKILIGNLLSFFKAAGFEATEEILLNLEAEERERVVVKGVEFRTFNGNFAVNLNLPPLLGLGRFSSRGYGSIALRLPCGC